jgi:hypothetical protein
VERREGVDQTGLVEVTELPRTELLGLVRLFVDLHLAGAPLESLGSLLGRPSGTVALTLALLERVVTCRHDDVPSAWWNSLAGAPKTCVALRSIGV